MADVFISYAREDHAFVQRLHAALAARQREAWVDWQGIAPTAEWMAEILRAIDGADAAVFVLSPSWIASRVCAEELAHAAGRRKRLIPIVCAPLDEDAPVPDVLARLNWVLMREGDDFDAAFERLINALATDFEHVREHTRLVLRSAEWDAHGRDRSGLLAGSQLTDAERWLAGAAALGDPTPTPLQAQYIAASRIRLSDKTSRLRPRHVAPKRGQSHEPEVPV